jgi:PAS domain S-box-containing protein
MAAPTAAGDPSYETLIEFLYLVPIGIVKFGPDGTIAMANPAAASLLMPLAPQGDMTSIFTLLAAAAPDLRHHVQRFAEPAGRILDQVTVSLEKPRVTLMLDISKINADTFMAVVQNVSELTEARREVMRRTEAQRMLASVFMHLSTPVVVVRQDGFILLANAAFQKAMGYDTGNLQGLHLDALLPPDPAGAVKAARLQQALDGKPFQMEITAIARDGTRFQAVKHAAILNGASDRQLRVITLLPVCGSRRGGPEAAVAQVRTISLHRYRDALPDDWPRIAQRAATLVEDAVRPLLGPADILKRGRDDSFIVWFADDDEPRHNAALVRAAQAIRRVFVTDFGRRVAQAIATGIAA